MAMRCCCICLASRTGTLFAEHSAGFNAATCYPHLLLLLLPPASLLQMIARCAACRTW
jgi:hypothetical protein